MKAVLSLGFFSFGGEGEHTEEKQDIESKSNHSGEAKLACSRQAIGLYKLHLLHHIFQRCLWKSSDHLGEYKKRRKIQFVLIRCEQPECLTELLFFVVLRPVGMSFLLCLCFRFEAIHI